MRIIYNNIIPFKGFAAINLYGCAFIRKEYKAHPWVVEKIIRHESIHTAQMKDFCKCLLIGGTIFYIIYFFEWIYRLLTPPMKTAYRDISFEVEAYDNADRLDYLNGRPRFMQWK